MAVITSTDSALTVNVRIEEEDHDAFATLGWFADALEAGDRLHIAVGDKVIETTVRSSGKHRVVS